MKISRMLTLLAASCAVGCAAVPEQVGADGNSAAPRLPSEFSVRWNFQAHYSYRVYTGLHEFRAMRLEPSGRVTGTVDVRSNNCRATAVPVEGSFNGSSLSLRTTRGVGECGILTVDLARTEGTSFKGSYGYSGFAGLGGMSGTFQASATLP